MQATIPNRPQDQNDLGSAEANICAILMVHPSPVFYEILGKECRAVVRLLAHAFKLRLGRDDSGEPPIACGHSGFGLICWNLPDRGRGLHVMRETLQETGYLDHSLLAWFDSAEGVWRVAHSRIPAEKIPNLDGVINAAIRGQEAWLHAMKALLADMGYNVPQDEGSSEGSESWK